MENIINTIPFECDSIERQDLPLCNETEKTRDDFRFLIKSLANEYKGWLFNDVVFNSQLLNRNQLNNVLYGDNFDSVANKVGELVANKIMNINQIMNFPIDNFATNELYSDILDMNWKEGSFENWHLSGYGDCSSKNCKKKMKLIHVYVKMLEVMSFVHMGPFGNFLSYFLNKIKLDKKLDNTFKYGKRANNQNWDHFCSLEKNEKFVQMYFTNLSKSIGFEENELVSLYDLPSMLSNANDEDMFNFHQNFLYSTCQDPVTNAYLLSGNFLQSPTYACFMEWKSLLYKEGKLILTNRMCVSE